MDQMSLPAAMMNELLRDLQMSTELYHAPLSTLECRAELPRPRSETEPCFEPAI